MSKEVNHGHHRYVKMSRQTCTSTLPITPETRNADPIEVIRGKSGMGEQGESGEES